jgi:hypothetical protein
MDLDHRPRAELASRAVVYRALCRPLPPHHRMDRRRGALPRCFQAASGGNWAAGHGDGDPDLVDERLHFGQARLLKDDNAPTVARNSVVGDFAACRAVNAPTSGRAVTCVRT